MKSLFKTALIPAGLALALALSVPAARAERVTWTFQNVVFDDGATLTGWFQFDAQAWNVDQGRYGVFGDFDFASSTGTGLGWHYSSFDGNSFGWWIDIYAPAANDTIMWAGNAFDEPYVNIDFSSMPSAWGTTIALDQNGFGWECSDLNNTFCRTIESGSIVSEIQDAETLPEPGSLALAGVGVLGMVLAVRRTGRGAR